MDPELIAMTVNIVVTTAMDRRRKLRELGFSREQIRQMEKNILGILAEKEINIKIQASLSEIPVT